MIRTHQGQPIRIVIADDHTLFRASLKTLLKDQPDLEVVGEAADGEGVCELVEDEKPDVLLLDLMMPRTDGHEVLRQLRSRRLPVKPLVLSASENRLQLSLALELGAKGIVAKSAASKALIDAIRQVQRGEMWVDPGFRHLIGKTPQPQRPTRRSRFDLPEAHYPSWSSLTPRERQIASLVSEGHRYKEIARRLGISDQTVRNHLRNIFDKLQVNDRVQLALYTLQRKT